MHLSEQTRSSFLSEMLCLADTDWVLGHWYIKVMMNGRSLTDCSSFAGIAQNSLGHTRAMFRFLEEELDFPEHQLEFGRGVEKIHDMAMLSAPPESWGDFVASALLAEAAIWRMLSTFKESSEPEIAGMVKHFGKELYFHRLALHGWLKAAEESERDNIRDSVLKRAPQVLAWFGSKERSDNDALLKDGIRSSSVWDARLGFIEDTLSKFLAEFGITDDQLSAMVGQSNGDDWDEYRRKPKDSVIPATLWEFMIPTDADTVALRRPLAVSIDDNLDLFDRPEYAEDD
ncbi:MAG: Phenylacetic acid catabolic protein [Pseudomonadales bacterium]